MSLFSEKTMQKKLTIAWSADTSSLWTADNPALGQCGVTAFLMRELFGGELLKTKVDGQWHFYNRIDGKSYDFTKSQFAESIHYDDLPATEEEIFRDSTYEQYKSLKNAYLGDKS
jgi:hypothetical protein